MLDMKYHIYIIFAMVFLNIGCSANKAPEIPEVELEQSKAKYSYASLWVENDSRNSLFHDYRAKVKGDIVTVLVSENTIASNKSKTKTNRDFRAGFSLATGSSPTNMATNTDYKFSGNGETGRSDNFKATVSCIVTEVLANGNFLIEGQRRTKINDEDQYVLVKGTIHPKDISSSNTIPSSKIANADIRYTGKGGIDEGRSPGWFTKILRIIWP